jgi:hypothetical protein
VGVVWHNSGECDLSWLGGTADLAGTRTPPCLGGFPGVSRGTAAGRQVTALGGIRQVVLLADRGFADVALRRLCGRLGWRYRRRIKSNFRVYRCGHGSAYVQQLLPKRRGKAVFLHYVCLTGERHGPLHLALAHSHDEADP